MRNLVAMLLVLVFGMASMARPSDRPKLSLDLIRLIEAAKPGVTGEVIVQFEQGPGEAERRKVEALGGKQLRVFASMRAGVYSMPLSNVKKLAEEPSVIRIAPNRTVSSRKPAKAESVLAEGDKK